MAKPPPITNTRTGHGPPPERGVHTLRYRQSSSPGGIAPHAKSEIGTRCGCGGGGPKAVASSSPAHGSTGPGGAQRRSPTGGAAKGMPRRAPALRPRRRPAEVSTTVLWLRTEIGPSASATARDLGADILQRLRQAGTVVAGLKQLHDVERGRGQVLGPQPRALLAVAALAGVEDLAVAGGQPRLLGARDVHAPVALEVIGELLQHRVDAVARRSGDTAVKSVVGMGPPLVVL